MRYIETLSTMVEKRWRVGHYDSATFPAVAHQALLDLPGHKNITPLQVLEWAATSRRLPPQDDPTAPFGEPAVRLFDNGRFYIQALFWFDGTTTIHHHQFAGAFQVLGGSSIHSQYAFKTRERYNAHLKLGEMSLTSIRLLAVGDTCSIPAGTSFVHSLFHLDEPSVTLVVRIHRDPEAGPQYTYLKPGIAIDTSHESPHFKTAAMTAQALSAAYKLGFHHFVALARKALVGADPEMTVHVLRACQNLVLAREWPTFYAKIEHSIRPRNRAWLKMLEGVMEEGIRQRRLLGCRVNVRDARLRFFFALLMNVAGRREILALIRARFPTQDPVALVVGWVRQLWNTQVIADDGSSISLLQLEGDARSQEPALAVLGALLRGETDRAIARSMPSFAGVGSICRLWRTQPLLGPLF